MSLCNQRGILKDLVLVYTNVNGSSSQLLELDKIYNINGPDIEYITESKSNFSKDDRALGQRN